MSSTRDVGANNLFWVKKLKIVHDSVKTYDILIKKVLENLFTFIYRISRKKKLILGVSHDSPVFA